MENPSPLPALSVESSITIFKADPGNTFVNGPFFP
jgi:hypothetical protein